MAKMKAFQKPNMAISEPTSFNNTPEFMTPQQVQELLQISRPTFFRMVQGGRLPGAFKVGKVWRVDRNKLKAWIDSKTQG